MIMNARISEEAKKMETESGKHAAIVEQTPCYFSFPLVASRSQLLPTKKEPTTDSWRSAKNSSGLS